MSGWGLWFQGAEAKHRCREEAHYQRASVRFKVLQAALPPPDSQNWGPSLPALLYSLRGPQHQPWTRAVLLAWCSSCPRNCKKWLPRLPSVFKMMAKPPPVFGVCSSSSTPEQTQQTGRAWQSPRPEKSGFLAFSPSQVGGGLCFQRLGNAPGSRRSFRRWISKRECRTPSPHGNDHTHLLGPIIPSLTTLTGHLLCAKPGEAAEPGAYDDDLHYCSEQQHHPHRLQSWSSSSVPGTALGTGSCWSPLCKFTHRYRRKSVARPWQVASKSDFSFSLARRVRLVIPRDYVPWLSF